MRMAVVIGCVLVCAGGLVMDRPGDHPGKIPTDRQTFEAVGWLGASRCATGDLPESDLKQIETTILLHDTIKSGCNRVEFGTVKVERDTAQVEVFYFSADQRMLPFLYKLISENK
jgi:hypothetical protein